MSVSERQSEIMKGVKKFIGWLGLTLMGWKYDVIPDSAGKKFVLVGFPHNSNRDALYGVLFSLANQIRTHALLKQEWMFWPMSWLFKLMGTIPVDRSQAHNLVQQIADEFAQRQEFRLVIFPEGTRSRVQKIKTGFWHIAANAQVPMVMLYKNEASKQLMILDIFKTGASLEEDLRRMHELYRAANYHEIDFLAQIDSTTT